LEDSSGSKMTFVEDACVASSRKKKCP